MKRREWLAAVGAATTTAGLAGLGGCLEEQAVECRPDEEDVRFGDVGFEDGQTAGFRGAVVGFSQGVLVDDTTGIARLTATDDQYIEMNELDVGTCLRGEGTIETERSWANRLPVFVVDRLESLGRAQRSVASIPQGPTAEFEATVDQDGCEATLTLRHDQGDPVPADQLRLVVRPLDGTDDTRRGWWYEFDNQVDPGEAVAVDDSLTVTVPAGREGTLAWVDDWSRQLVGWETESC